MIKTTQIFLQVFCGVVVSAAMLEVGAVVAWPVVLPGLQRDNDTSLVVTDNDVKWLGTTAFALTLPRQT